MLTKLILSLSLIASNIGIPSIGGAQASPVCTAEKVYSESGEYLGCKVVFNSGREEFYKPTGMTQLGCDTTCRAEYRRGFTRAVRLQTGL